VSALFLGNANFGSKSCNSKSPPRWSWAARRAGKPFPRGGQRQPGSASARPGWAAILWGPPRLGQLGSEGAGAAPGARVPAAAQACRAGAASARARARLEPRQLRRRALRRAGRRAGADPGGANAG
jgi:hypothetical protein